MLEKGTDEFGPIGHGWTYSAHPIGAAAGIANLKLIDSLGLVENAGEDRRLLHRRSSAKTCGAPTSATSAARACCRRSSSSRTPTPHASSIPRGRSAPRSPARSSKRGVIGRAMPQGDILGFAPPLCLTKAEADTIAERLAEAIEEVAKGM